MCVLSLSLSSGTEFVPFFRCAGAGHLRDDILYYSKELEKFVDGDDEHRAYLMDVGVKALRLVLFFFFLASLIIYRVLEF